MWDVIDYPYTNINGARFDMYHFSMFLSRLHTKPTFAVTRKGAYNYTEHHLDMRIFR